MNKILFQNFFCYMNRCMHDYISLVFFKTQYVMHMKKK